MRRATPRRTGIVLAALALAASACAPLPPWSEGMCGNFVVEEGEDCDGHAPAPGTCAAMNTPNECRFVCDPAVSEPRCPAGLPAKCW